MKLRFAFGGVVLGLLLVSFNNCGKGFVPADEDVLASESQSPDTALAAPTPTPLPVPTPTPAPRVLNVNRGALKLYETVTFPQALNTMANTWVEPQYSYLDTRVPSRGYVVLYLMGAGTVTPLLQIEGLKVLAGFGLHVVCPDYAQDYGIDTGCAVGDLTCRGLKRREAFEGIDHSPLINVTPANSIEQRFTKLLQFLAATQPDGDWGYFLTATGQPRWDKVIVAGLSHGASSAALIGKLRSVARVVGMSGPLDVFAGNTPDAWLTTPGLTSLNKYYFLSHTADPQYAGHQVAWSALGVSALGPGVLDIAGRVAPYGNSHALKVQTTYTNPHGSTAPTSNESRAALLPVWRYMFIP